MAMAHGLQRQKMFNMYEETLNIPFIRFLLGVVGPLGPRASRPHRLSSTAALPPTRRRPEREERAGETPAVPGRNSSARDFRVRTVRMS